MKGTFEESKEESKEERKENSHQRNINEDSKSPLKRLDERWNSNKFDQLQSNLKEIQSLPSTNKDLSKGMIMQEILFSMIHNRKKYF